MSTSPSEEPGSFAAAEASGDADVRHVALDTLPLPVLIYDARTLRIFAANRAAAQIFEYSRAELCAMSVADLVPRDEIALMRASVAASGRVPNFAGPFQYRAKHGSIEVEVAVSSTTFAGREARLAIVRVRGARAVPPVDGIRTPNEDAGQAPVLVWTTDAHLRLASSVSALAGRYVSASPKPVGTPMADLFRGFAGADAALEAHRSALTGHPAEFALSGTRHYRCFVDALRDSQHEIVGVVGLAFEISEQVHLRRALTSARSSLRVAEETARMGTFEFDVTRGRVTASATLRSLLRVSAGGSITAESFFKRVHPNDRAMVRRAYREARKRNVPFRIEHRIVLEDGTAHWLESTAEPVVDDQGRVTLLRGAITDVTARKEVEEQLAFLAHYDPLTGLANRTLLAQRLTSAIEQARRDESVVAVIFMDLDDFKRINDIYGDGEGDRVIRTCASRLGQCVHPRDTVARVAGDEFVIVLADPDGAAGAARTVACMQSALAEPILIDNIAVRLSASFGISCYPSDADSAEQLIGFADMAMFRAKKTCRGEFAYFEAGLHKAATERLRLEHELRDAIHSGQLQVHYQPIVDARTKRAHGVEALVRWQHPSEGMKSPARFIPLAEETGLIVPLGEFVLCEALRDAAELHRSGFPELRIAVNLSARQLHEDRVPEMVRAALADARVPARLLDLEVTESFLVTDPKRAASLLEELVALGVSIALDDFGTGYSALSFLRQFPVHQLKLDRSFVTEIEQNATARAIAGTIIDLAHTLNMRSLAEGVETHPQHMALNDLGCELFQGYHFARPMPIDALKDYLRTA